jgi:predicted metal-binding membrane protein
VRARLQEIARRPALGVELAIAAAWIVVGASMEGPGAAGASPGAPSSWLCTLNMSGMTPSAGSARSGLLTHQGAIAAGLPMWGLMATAMMLPTALPAVRHVHASSVYWRRRRATVEFAVVYIGIWAAFGAAVLGLLSSQLPSYPGPTGGALLALAALWQLTPLKRRALWACHQGRTLPPHGWRATLGVVRFGLLNGTACLGSCWALMLTTAVAGSARLAWMAVLTAIVMAEKLSLKQGLVRRRVALLLAAAALGWLLSAVLG